MRVYDVNFRGSIRVMAHNENEAYERAMDTIGDSDMEVEIDEIEYLECDPNDPRI